MEKLTGAETKLERACQKIANNNADGYNTIKGWVEDLLSHGCVSGMVSELIYYRDTVKFYKNNRVEIQALLKDTLQETGCNSPADLFGDKWDKEDIFATDDLNRNLLAWFAFEETIRNLASRKGIEV